MLKRWVAFCFIAVALIGFSAVASVSAQDTAKKADEGAEKN